MHWILRWICSNLTKIIQELLALSSRFDLIVSFLVNKKLFKIHNSAFILGFGQMFARRVKPLMYNLPKGSGICCKIIKVCLTILGHYALKSVTWYINLIVHKKFRRRSGRLNVLCSFNFCHASRGVGRYNLLIEDIKITFRAMLVLV